MDWESALTLINAAVLSELGRPLRDPEITILRGTWQGHTYEQMAESSDYSLNYLMRDIGPKVWRLLSEVLGERVSKTNIRIILERLEQTTNRSTFTSSTDKEAFHPVNEPLPPEISPIPGLQVLERSTANAVLQQPWNLATGPFSDRSTELDRLRQWILEEHGRLIGVSGLSGIGKTALLSELVGQVQDAFEVVIWCPLQQAPTLMDLQTHVTQLLSLRSTSEDSSPALQLLNLFRTRSCLLILDAVDSLLQGQHLFGHWRAGYEDYGEFLRQVGESAHRSCVVTAGLETPREIIGLEGENFPVRSFTLLGLSEQAAYPILETEHLTARRSWASLINHYRGHPAALKVAAKFIRELLNGNVASFLHHRSFVFEAIEELLDRSFQRLSNLEKEILYWLASEGKPVSLADIQDQIPLSVYPIDLLEALESLRQRSLIETTHTSDQSLFALQPIVMEYVTNQFIAQVKGSNLEQWHYQPLLPITNLIDLSPAIRKPVQLSHWLHHQFEPAWRSVEELFSASAHPALRLRSTFHLRGQEVIKRFKSVQLGTAVDRSNLILLVAVIPEADQVMQICVQAQPTDQTVLLPAHLKLRLLDASQQILAEVEARNQDSFIQLPYFRGAQTERFSIQIALAEIKHTEEFVI